VLPGMAGLMVTVPGILAAIAAPALMLGAGRIDRRRILILLSALLLASSIISALSSNFAVMLIGRALLGASLGGFWTLAPAAAGRLVQPQESPRATAMILAGVTLATVIGVPVGTFISEMASWRISFIATSVLAGVALLAQLVLVPRLPSKAALRMSDLVDVFRERHSRRSLLMVAFIFGAHFSSYTFITPFLLSIASFSSDSVPWILLGFGIIGFAANFAGTALVARTLPGTLAGVVLTLMSSLTARRSCPARPVPGLPCRPRRSPRRPPWRWPSTARTPGA